MTDESNTQQLPLQSALEALDLEDARLESSESRATDTRVWRVSHEGRSLAIRVFRETQKQAMRTEVAAMTRALEHGLPVPEVVATGMVDDRRPAMAISWLRGEPAGDVVLVNPALVRPLARSAASVLSRIHQVPAPSDVSGQGWIDRGCAGDDELRAQLNRVSTPDPVLLHLDYHPFNLLAEGRRVTGVVDWTNAAYGDPRADIARTVSLMQLIAPAGIGIRGSRRMTLGLFLRSFLRAYTACSGPLQNMAPFYAWAGNTIVKDLGHKLEIYPLVKPDVLRNRIDRWTETWLERARASTLSD